MSLYLYSGPDTAFTLRTSPEGCPTDIIAWSGTVIELPPTHELVRVLSAKGWLVPAPAGNVSGANVSGGSVSGTKSAKSGKTR